MPTFGDITAGGSSFPTSGDRAIVRSFTLVDSADLVSITLFFDGSSGSNSNHKGLIYADSAGSPGTLVAQTSAAVLPTAGTSLTIPIAGTLAPGTYWIGAVADNFTARWAADAGAGGQRQEAVTYTTPASSFGTPAGSTADGISAYVTYNISGALPTRPASDVTVFGWVATPAGVCATTLDEASTPDDVDYVTSPDLRSSPEVLRMALAGAVLAGNIAVAVRASVNTGTGHLTVRFFNASGSDIGSTPAQALDTTPTTFTLLATLSDTATHVQIEVTT